jgi:hypothetical protein
MDCYQTAADCVLIKTQLQPRKQTDPQSTAFETQEKKEAAWSCFLRGQNPDLCSTVQ